jgi:catechol 2,3-dioxygenase-like lactoylglutathione lyase family enzyme
MFGKVDSLLLFVSDLKKSQKFYSALDFKISQSDNKSFKAVVGDFIFWCFDQNQATYKKDAGIEPKGAGVFIYLRVKNVDKYYAYLIGKNLTPSSQPKDQPWGNREFAIKDPDGYKIVVYAPL